MTLKYISEKSLLQRFPLEFVEHLKSVGWEETAKYRSRVKGTDTYAEVRLMRAIGSDGQTRQFGIVHAYDLQAPTFMDERFITFQSQLANLGVGNGTLKKFYFPSGQVLPDTVEIQVNGVTVKDGFTVDTQGRFVEFTAAPTGVIKSSHKLSSKAHEPTNCFGVFLFDQYEMARTVVDETLVSVGGNKYKFANKNIMPASIVITEDGATVDALEYTLDKVEGTITFTNAVTAPVAKYAYYIAPIEDNDYGDLLIEPPTLSATLNSADDLANLAYSAVRFTKPSPLTLLTLSSENNYDVTVNRDTLISYWGSINKDRLILHFQTYTAHDAAKHYFVPFYLGRVISEGAQPMQNTVLIGGCHTGKQSQYVANKKTGNILVDYGAETTNGNEYPLLHQSIGGMYYQRHYLAFTTHAKETDLPTAGQGPSAYDNKYHNSFMYITHKFDQEVGHLDDVYAMHPLGINQNAEMELNNTYVKKHIGTGDGITKVFHIPHHAKENPIVEVNCTVQSITYNDDYKTVTFATAPAKGARICASYTAHNMFIFNVTDAPIAPMQLGTATPYVNIGWGVFQKKL